MRSRKVAMLITLCALLSACASSGRQAGVGGCSAGAVPDPAAVYVDPAALAERIAELTEATGRPARIAFTVRYMRGAPVVTARDSALHSPDLLSALEAAVAAATIPLPEDSVFPMHRLIVDGGGLETVAVPMCRPELLNHDEMSAALQRAQARMQASGTVLVHILLDEAGVPQEVTVERSSGNDFIDAAAVATGYIMRFAPATVDGLPLPVYVAFPITFVPR